MFMGLLKSRAPAVAAGLLMAVALASPAQAAGLLTPTQSGLPALEIQDHAVTVVVEDGYAVTTIDQVFRNPNDRDLEAVYSFPVPEQGAVAEFTYWIDGQPVSGEVLPKQEARQIYEEEKAAGRETAITEQDSYKTFDISVSPVRAGQDVRIRLSYFQPAHMDTGIGRFVYPLEEGGVDEARLAFWTANEVVAGTFSFDLTLRSAYPVAGMRLPSHPGAQIGQTASGDWHVHIDNLNALSPPVGAVSDLTIMEPDTTLPDAIPASLASAAPVQAHRLDTDIVVYWRHAENLPGSVDLVAHRPPGSDRGTFMLVVTPGDDLQPITEGSDWVFVLDKSGSMGGKIATLVDGVDQALRKMRPDDRFRIVMFDDAPYEVTNGFVNATPAGIDQAMAALRRVAADNSTNLFAGLDFGLKGLDADRTSAVILVTDGVANVGETRRRAFLDLIRSRDIRLFTFIMGNSANRPLLTAITEASNGTALSVSNSDDVVGAVLSASSKVTHEALHDVSLSIDGVRTADIAPRVTRSLYRGEQLVLFGHYWGQGEANVVLEGRISGQPVRYETRFVFPDTAVLNPEIERLWAFSAIEEMMREIEDFGQDADRRQAVVDLAVENGLVTPFTSMLVVREEVFAQRNIDRSNQARLTQEQTAQQQRAAQPVRTARVDAADPMFQSPRPGYSRGSGGGGSGSIGFVGGLIVLLAGLAVYRVRRATAG